MNKLIGNDEREGSKTDTREESGQIVQKGKDRECVEESMSTSPQVKGYHRSIRDGMGRPKSKKKRQRGLNGEDTDESPLKIAKRRLSDSVSPFKAV
ncbi:reverse transcriptase [Gossypium australe]|uniref:Reverse transcriptase n=1 Tax=Gossypium australe TaxID=47621 RepID=A0A5B6VUI4_9ROSI|nr:reverse transcriptase [Gossypium australe]